MVLTPRAQAHGRTWQEEPFLGSLQTAEGWGFHVFMAVEPLTSLPQPQVPACRCLHRLQSEAGAPCSGPFEGLQTCDAFAKSVGECGVCAEGPPGRGPGRALASWGPTDKQRCLSSSQVKLIWRTSWTPDPSASPRQWAGGPYGTLWGWRTATSPRGTPCSTSAFSWPSEIWMRPSGPSSSSRGEGLLAQGGAGGSVTVTESSWRVWCLTGSRRCCGNRDVNGIQLASWCSEPRGLRFSCLDLFSCLDTS